MKPGRSKPYSPPPALSAAQHIPERRRKSTNGSYIEEDEKGAWNLFVDLAEERCIVKGWIGSVLGGLAIIVLVSACSSTPVAYGTINNVGQRWGFGGGPQIDWHSQSISGQSPRYEVSFDNFCYRVNTHMTLATPIKSPDDDRLVSIRTDANDCKLIIIMERPELDRTPGQDDWSIYNDILFTPVAFAVFEL